VGLGVVSLLWAGNNGCSLSPAPRAAHDSTAARLLDVPHPSAANCVLYLDFDGVLHPEPVFFHPNRGVYLGAEAHEHTLFEHAQLLVSILAPYPAVRIVLATSWVQHRSYSKAAKRLPAELRERLIGATFHDGHMSRDNWLALSRGAQVLGDVGRRRPAHWVALDDDNVDWPENYLGHLVKTDAMLGLTRPGAVDELLTHLEKWRVA
jgi:hypothetical protein